MPADAKQDLVERNREEFDRLFARHGQRIRDFIVNLVYSHHDAEEVFQNTSVTMWNKFGDFQLGTNFFAWASRIAYFEILNLINQNRRSRRVTDRTLDWLASDAATTPSQIQSREAALEECLARLSPEDRELVRKRYYQQQRPKQIAASRSRSVDSVYRALNRIHNVLLRCVQRTLAREELA